MKTLKIAIVDDHPMCRDGLNFIFRDSTEFKVVCQASNGDEFLNFLFANPQNVDVVLMDIVMPILGGIETAIRAKEFRPDLKIIYLSGYANVQKIESELLYGASAYLTKDSEADHLIAVIKAVAKNEPNFRDFTKLENNRDYILQGLNLECKLTAKEIEITRLICAEMENAEIAESLKISVLTVKSHRQNIFNKTGAKRLAGLIKFAYIRGIIEPLEI